MFKKVNLLDGVPRDDLEAREALAKRHAQPLLPSLPYTETHVEWILLYDHARGGQIEPQKLRRMKRADLEFLAGMANPQADMYTTQPGIEQAAKLLGNVTRASRELSRRDLRNATIIAASSALGGVILGVLAAHL